MASIHAASAPRSGSAVAGQTQPSLLSPPSTHATAARPRRTFGSSSRPSASGTAAFGAQPTSTTSSTTVTGSSTPTGSTVHLVVPPGHPEPQRTRSTSSASASGAAQFAAERAQQWLQAFAPRGEGRGREFLSSTLTGVANVASTVGHDINGFISGAGASMGAGVGGPGSTGSASSDRPSHSRPNSFSASSPPDGIVVPLRKGSRGSLSPPAPPIHTASAPHMPSQLVGRRIPQPANASRLGAGGGGSALITSPVTSPTRSSFRRPSSSNPSSSTSSLPLAGSSTQTNSAGPIPRRQSSQSHTRAPSVGVTASGTHSSSSTVSRSSSVTAPQSKLRQAGMPYKIGFQPSGVRVDRTEEFKGDRRKYGAERDKEEGRLGRRWAKIIDLHFNPTMQALPPTLTRSSSSTFSLSSIANKRKSLLSIDMALDSIKPKEMWKGIKTAAGPGAEESRKRAVEQTIVKWEDDAEVKKCRICQATFTLSTRKHHCRLCGKIVCSLPPTPPALLAVQIQLFSPADPEAASNPSTATTQAALPPGTRREKCSLLLVADWKTGRGEEVDEGFVGWMTIDENASGDGEKRAGVPDAATIRTKRKSRVSDASTLDEPADGRPLPMQPQEVQVKGVRTCRECWAVVSRKQKMQDRQRVTPFQRLYHALRSVQAEIDSVLPDYEEQLFELNSVAEPGDPPADLINLHKQLLGLLTEYDIIAKRISNVPCAEGGSQQQVQSALARSAATFLAKAMVKVQELPKLQRQAAAAKAKNLVVVETTLPDVLRAEGVSDDAAEQVAAALQPLLEQQAQLESFIAEANAQRKYDDSRSLAVALAEIEAEIGRLTVDALK